MLRIADKVFDSHLFTGTGKFASPQLMVEAIRESGSQLVTLALKRVDLRHHSDAILAPLLEADWRAHANLLWPDRAVAGRERALCMHAGDRRRERVREPVPESGPAPVRSCPVPSRSRLNKVRVIFYRNQINK